ncbi:hypothetical protein, partial [Fulvivirga kasyanovii]
MGTALAQAVPVILSPVISRIYLPAHLGLAGIFLSLTNIFGPVSNGKYDLAIHLPKKDKDSIQLTMVGICFSAIFCLLLFCIIAIFNVQISSILQSPEMQYWLFFVPASAFFIGCFEMLMQISTRF